MEFALARTSNETQMFKPRTRSVDRLEFDRQSRPRFDYQAGSTGFESRVKTPIAPIARRIALEGGSKRILIPCR